MKDRFVAFSALSGVAVACAPALGVVAAFDPNNSNITGSTNGFAQPVGGGDPITVEGSTVQAYTATTATGGTSGGQVDGPIYGRSQFNASITTLRGGHGGIKITYQYEAYARVDTSLVTGNIGTAFIGRVYFTVDETTPFFLTVVGNFGDDTVQLRNIDNQVVEGSTLQRGTYYFYHEGGVFATSAAGGSPLVQQGFLVSLALPGPGAGSLILAGLVVASRRRRRAG